jgi:hypothetical protein
MRIDEASPQEADMRRLLVRSFMVAVVASAAGGAPAAAQSTLDVQRARAASLFDRRLDSLSAARNAVADEWMKYERACRGKVTSGRGVGIVFQRSELVWFAHAFEIDNETTPECRMLAIGMKTRSQQIARDLEHLDEDARRGGVYPGVMRDLKRRYGFE